MSYSKRVKADLKLKHYDKVLHEFCNTGGKILVCTEDQAFFKAVRFALEQVGLDFRQHVTEVTDYDTAVTRLTKEIEKRKLPTLVFLERKIGARSYVKPLKVLKEFYPEKARVIVSSDEIGRGDIVLIFEVGADSLIIKPISVNAIIEKMAFAIKPNNELSVLFDRANELVEQGDLDGAERIAERVFEVKADSLAGHILLGDVATKRGNFEDARDHYLNAAKSERLYVKPLQRLVDLAKKTGDTEAQLEYLNRLEKLSPLNYERKIEIGEVYVQMDDMEQAQNSFQEAKKVVKRVADEMVSESLMRMAKSVSDKDKDMALQYMEEAIALRGESLGKDDLWMFNERGIILRQQGRWEEAIDNYKKALKVVPDDGGIHYNIGVAYAVGKEHRKALQYYAKAIDVDKEVLRQSPAIPFNMGLSYLHVGNRTNARKMFRYSLEIDEKYAPAQRMLAKLDQSS